MATKYDFNESYVSELSKFQELFILGADRTSSGSGSWESTSSSTIYTYTNGEDDLYTQLQAVLADYQISASDYNTIESNITQQNNKLINLARKIRMKGMV